MPATDGFVASLLELGNPGHHMRHGGVAAPLGKPAVIHLADRRNRFSVLAAAMRAAWQEFSTNAIGREQALSAHADLVAVQFARSVESGSLSASAETRLVALVETDYAKHQSLDVHTRALGVTTTHLTRCCRSVLGCPARRVVHDCLLIEARRRLVYSSALIAKIAYELGFSDAAYFFLLLRRPCRATAESLSRCLPQQHVGLSGFSDRTFHVVGLMRLLTRAGQAKRGDAMPTPRIAVLNGPNLNLLGEREPHIYGSTTLPEIESAMKIRAEALGVEIECHQSNHEGVLVDLIQAARKTSAAIVINPAGFSFFSVPVLDALKTFEGPIVELHISNIHARDENHRHSRISGAATGVICGLGPFGYLAALEAAAHMIGAVNGALPTGIGTEGAKTG